MARCAVCVNAQGMALLPGVVAWNHIRSFWARNRWRAMWLAPAIHALSRIARRTRGCYPLIGWSGREVRRPILFFALTELLDVCLSPVRSQIILLQLGKSCFYSMLSCWLWSSSLTNFMI